MTTLEIILTFIVSIVTVFTGSQSVLFYRQTKRLKALENKEKEATIDLNVSSGWSELVSELRSEKKELTDEKEKLETEYNELREKHLQTLTEKEQLLCENIKLKLTHCEIVSCPSRKPPTGY